MLRVTTLVVLLTVAFGRATAHGDAASGGNGGSVVCATGSGGGSDFDPFAAVRALGVIVGELRRLALAESDELDAAALVAADAPVLVTGSALQRWPALSLWTDRAALARRAGVLREVQSTRGASCVFRYWHGEHPLANVSAVRRHYRRLAATSVDMDAARYFARMDAQRNMYEPWGCDSDDGGGDGVQGAGGRAASERSDTPLPSERKTSDSVECVYYGAPLAATAALDADCEPRDEFIVGLPERAKVQLWLGARGLTTHLHYDRSPNFFAQVLGAKRLLLFAPADAQRLYLYPALHPAAQASQVDVLAPNLTRFPDFASARAYDVTLRRGEVLFLPPLWFHHVVSLDTNAAVSMWSPDQADAVLAAARELPLPLPKVWRSELERVVVMRLLIVYMAEALAGSAPAGAALVATLFSQRYAPLLDAAPELGVAPRNRSFCLETMCALTPAQYRVQWEGWSDDDEPVTLAWRALLAVHEPNWTGYADQVVRLFVRVPSASRREVAALDFVEMLALTAVRDPNAVVAFVRDLAAC